MKKEDVLQVIKHKGLLIVNSLYLPFVGECQVVCALDALRNVDPDHPVLESGLRAVKQKQVDEEGSLYEVVRGESLIDFKQMIVSGRYKKVWDGGWVEHEKFTYPITKVNGWKLSKTEPHYGLEVVCG